MRFHRGRRRRLPAGRRASDDVAARARACKGLPPRPRSCRDDPVSLPMAAAARLRAWSAAISRAMRDSRRRCSPGLPALVRVNVRGSNAGVWLRLRCATRWPKRGRPTGRRRRAGEARRGFVHRGAAPLHERAEPPAAPAGSRESAIASSARALNALHARPAYAWTLEELAHEAPTSRSVLAERFQLLVGSSPMQYLTQWRMLLAANLLARSNAPLARIAEDVGYQTDTAFSRAFRRSTARRPRHGGAGSRRDPPTHRCLCPDRGGPQGRGTGGAPAFRNSRIHCVYTLSPAVHARNRLISTWRQLGRPFRRVCHGLAPGHRRGVHNETRRQP